MREARAQNQYKQQMRATGEHLRTGQARENISLPRQLILGAKPRMHEFYYNWVRVKEKDKRNEITRVSYHSAK